MKSRIYALSVGIDDYAPEVGALSGCVNDVDRFQSLLHGRYANSDLRSEVLRNADATRDNIIRLFRTHLNKATAQDTVIFQFCGHGAQSKSAQAFERFFPGGKDEGLVCFDSRSAGGHDLADKELAILLAEVARQQPHIAVILDCCHSGSGTRSIDDFAGLTARQTHEVFDERPLESYLEGHYSALVERGDTLRLPASRHVLLAACERFEKAYETEDKHGVFSTALVNTLEQSNGVLSYADVFLRCRSRVRKAVDNQTPQFETYGGFSAYAGFLGGKTTQQPKRFAVTFDKDQWQVDCGALHGLPNQPEKPVELILFDESDPTTSLRAKTQAIGPQRSTLTLSEPDTQTSRRFYAELTSIPVPPLLVVLDGSAIGETRVLTRVTEQAATTAPDIALTQDTSAGARYALAAENGGFQIRDCANASLIHGVAGNDEAAVRYILSALQKINSWQRVSSLRNPSSQIDPGHVSFSFQQILKNGNVHDYASEHVSVTVSDDNSEENTVRGKLLAKNASPRVLHFLLIYLSEDHGVTVLYNERVEAGTESFELLMDGDPVVDFTLDDDEGDRALHHFKLVITTEKVDDFVLDQSPLERGRTIELNDRGAAFGAARKKLAAKNDWLTKDLHIEMLREASHVQADDVSLCNGAIVIKGHPTLQAGVCLQPMNNGSRGIDNDALIQRYLQRSGLQAVDFTPSRGIATTQTLELTDIRNAASLTRTPLQIELQTPLADGEYVLPVTFDGEHMLVVGQPCAPDAGKVRVSIDSIPDVANTTRSLGKAIKLYFLRTWLKRDAVNKLCWVEYHSDGTLTRHADQVADKVSQASRIVLLVHGIIGDTQVIATGLTNSAADDGRPLKDAFDLVLSFDYENLNTPIEQTALDLKQQLSATGFNNDDDKKLTIIAHSMGGLVSRWMIEKENGRTFVDHLIMCGTPNQGSPFGKIDDARKLSSVLTGLAVNFFTPLAVFGGALLYALNRSRKLTRCLEQMNPDSDFLHALNSSDDPGVKYSIIAADARSYAEPSDERVARLVAKLGGSGLFDALYESAAHDIAVSDSSIRGVSAARSPAPDEQVLHGHHLNYFVNEASLKAIAAAIEG